MPNPTTEDLYDCLQRIGQNDPVYGEIEPEALQKLIEFRIAELGLDGTPRLTAYGERCYVGLESGDWGTPEFHDAGGA
jgi:hypothetical protein